MGKGGGWSIDSRASQTKALSLGISHPNRPQVPTGPLALSGLPSVLLSIGVPGQAPQRFPRAVAYGLELTEGWPGPPLRLPTPGWPFRVKVGPSGAPGPTPRARNLWPRPLLCSQFRLARQLQAGKRVVVPEGVRAPDLGCFLVVTNSRCSFYDLHMKRGRWLKVRWGPLVALALQTFCPNPKAWEPLQPASSACTLRPSVSDL